MIIAGTGHRPVDGLNSEYDLNGPYSNYVRTKTIEFLKEKKPDTVISGMALGFDIILIEAAISLGIKCIAAIPCIEQEKIWPEKSQIRYHNVLNNPLVTKHYVSNEPYTHSCMQKRNEWMINRADLIIAMWNGKRSGGTYNAITYAKKLKKEIYYINPDDANDN